MPLAFSMIMPSSAKPVADWRTSVPGGKSSSLSATSAISSAGLEAWPTLKPAAVRWVGLLSYIFDL